MTRSLCHAATLPLCLLIIAACGGSGKSAVATKPTMRDSAGVTIVENVDKAPFIEATKAVREKYGAEYGDLLRKIEANK